MMNHLPPTDEQKKVAELLGIDISDDSLVVAAARIRDVVEPAIRPGTEYRPATDKQLKHAESLGIEVAGDSLWVCWAKINEKLRELNQEARERLQLIPGMYVWVIDEKVNERRIMQVSTIGKNGRVYFKGGGGASAWPTQLEAFD
jgi:hypothetical protein